jgi:hypothetical protein
MIDSWRFENMDISALIAAAHGYGEYGCADPNLVATVMRLTPDVNKKDKVRISFSVIA